jgi:uncharacterized integral membrane protein
MKYFITFILTVLFLGILIFIFQNSDPVVLKFITFKAEVVSGLMILTSVFLGILFTATAILPNLILKNYKLKELEKEIEKLKVKIKNETIVYDSPGLGSEGMDYLEKKG